MAGGAATPAELILEVIRLRDQANGVAHALLGSDGRLIGELSLPTPPLDPPELGFIRAVAWLYGQYLEAGAVGVKFLTSLFEGWGVDSDGALRSHLALTPRLRTFLQHNLDFARDHDRETREVCERWFEDSCGTRVPGHADHWTACLQRLMSDAKALFDGLVYTLRAIEADEGREQIVRAWRFRIDRYHPPSDFDAVIEEAAADMGREHLDILRFRRRFYDRWAEALRSLDAEYDFAREARRLVEHSLLTELAAALPITGTDVIVELGVQPGPAVGRALERAQSLFAQAPSSRDELLERLAADLQPGN